MSTAQLGFSGSPPSVAVGKVNPESSKYLKLYKMEEYRRTSFGEEAVRLFLDCAKPPVNATLIDFGCGTGRAGLKLHAIAGLDVTMIDFVKNCLDEHVKKALGEQLKFVTHDLETPIPYTAEYGFCADTMEHIPQMRVQTVLRNILKAARNCFFEIATVEDKGGELIGETLHLTVHDYRWWCHQFAMADAVIHWSDEAEGHCFFYVSAWTKSNDVVKVAKLNNEVDEIVSHIRQNCADGWRQVEPDIVKEGVEVMILGGGPSLNQFADEIKQKRADGLKLVTLNGSYNWALAHDLTPSATIILDSREFNHRFVEPVVDNCKYLISSGCHPRVFEKLPKEQTWIWHAICSEIGTEVLNEIYSKGGWYAVPGGSTAMLRSIPLLRMLGYKRFHLYGCDSCLMDGQHHAYEQTENNSQRVVPVFLRPSPKPFYVHNWMLVQAQEFVKLIKLIGDEIELAVYGDGLLAHILNTQAELAMSEYEAMTQIMNGEKSIAKEN